jgi:NADPH dehydrogenase (quinone)
MKNILIINTHLSYPYSEGKLNSSLIEKMKEELNLKWYNIKTTIVENWYDINEEIEKHTWADVIIVQIPVNWMWVPWIFKKYIDEVYSAWINWILGNWDWRTRSDENKQYWTWWLLIDKKYMLSLTYNAPKEAFNDKNQYLMQWKTPDDMFLPYHLNFRFFWMKPIETFVCYDVIKNPQIENDFIRLKNHLNNNF